jgi:chromosomal replication initiator protein
VSSHWKDDEQLELGEDESVIALRRAWDRTLRTIAGKVSKSSFESFFLVTQPLSLEDNVVVLGAPSRFAREWLDKRYNDTLRNLLRQHLNQSDIQIRFVLSSPDTKPAILADQEAMPPVEAAERESLPEKPRSRKTPTVERPKPLPPELTIPLNDKFTFDTFVTGKSNRLAHAGACAVADAPGLVYNPLFLYGQPGLGKTHLMHAIGHQIRQNHPEARVAYISGESFTNSYVTALRERRFDEFRSVYRNVDVWLVDDIQTIAGKEHTKEEFFHTFNTLHQMNKQIVISSDRSPRELRMMDERLRSRFECGLLVDVAPPELEMRVAILQKKAEIENIPIPEDVLIYMANLIQSNIRALEGALVKLMAYASLFHSPVTRQLASDVLGSYFVEKRPQPYIEGSCTVEDADDLGGGLRALPIPAGIRLLSESSVFGGGGEFDHIVQTVASYFALDPAELAGDGSATASRKRDHAMPRQIAIYLARERTTIPVVELARLFGDVSHSAVSHAHRKMVKLLNENPRVLSQVTEIKSRL